MTTGVRTSNTAWVFIRIFSYIVNDRAVAQGVSRRDPTAADPDATPGLANGICGCKCVTGVELLWVLWFHLQITAPTAVHSSLSLSKAGTIGHLAASVIMDWFHSPPQEQKVMYMRKTPSRFTEQNTCMGISISTFVQRYLWPLTNGAEYHSRDHKLCSLSVDSQHFYGTRRFITEFTRAFHLYLTWARPIQSTNPIPSLKYPS
jgi:hypothetical protein